MGGIAAIGALMSGVALGGIGLAMGSGGGGSSSSSAPALGSSSSSASANARRSIIAQQDSALTSQFQTTQLQSSQQAMAYNNQPNRQYVDNPNRLRNILRRLNSMNQNTNQNGQ